MRVLALSWKDPAHPAAGGSEAYLHEVAKCLVARGDDVDLFCAVTPGQAPTAIMDGVRVIRRGGRLTVYREAQRFYREAGRGRYDVVLDVVNTRPFLTPRFVDVPVVALIFQVAREIWFHEVPFPAAVLGRFWLEPRWLRMYATVPTLTISSSSADSLRRYGLRDVTVLPVGTAARTGASAPSREARPTIVFVGRLVSNKRPDHAVDSFRLVQAVLPDAQLWVVGAGPMEASLRRKAPPGATFFGRVDDATKADLLARAHVLVATSVREGWGLVVNEAAAAGTFVVAYDVPGLRDSVDLVGGELTDPDPKALAARLVAVLQDDALRSLAPVGRAGPAWSEVAEALRRKLEVALDRR